MNCFTRVYRAFFWKLNISFRLTVYKEFAIFTLAAAAATRCLLSFFAFSYAIQDVQIKEKNYRVPAATALDSSKIHKFDEKDDPKRVLELAK